MSNYSSEATVTSKDYEPPSEFIDPGWFVQVSVHNANNQLARVRVPPEFYSRAYPGQRVRVTYKFGWFTGRLRVVEIYG